MAGDWIKVSTDIAKKPEVIIGARTLSVSRYEFVGICVGFWAWADHQTADGYLAGMEPDDLDAIMERQGFGAVMKRIGWLLQDDGGLMVPNFERHNGRSGKRRASDANRKREARCRNG